MNYTKGKWKVEDGCQVVCGHRLVANTGGYSTNYSETRSENIANACLIAAAPAMYEALKEISEGKGRYSLDPLTHASNTIDDMKEVAVKALIKAEESK